MDAGLRNPLTSEDIQHNMRSRENYERLGLCEMNTLNAIVKFARPTCHTPENVGDVATMSDHSSVSG
jgi:hypothetical protein